MELAFLRKALECARRMFQTIACLRSIGLLRLMHVYYLDSEARLGHLGSRPHK